MSEETGSGALKSITKGAGLVFIGIIFADFFSYLNRIFIGRWLGPSDYGMISLGLAVLGILTTISMLGLNTGITRYISFFKGKDDERRIKGTITTSLKISFPIGLVLSAVFFIFSADMAVMIFHNAELVPIMQIFSLVLPFNIILTVVSSSIRGFQQPKYKVFANDIFFSVSKISFVVAAILLGYGALGAAAGWGAAIIGTAILSFYYLERRIFPIIGTKVISGKVARDLLIFSLPLMLGSTVKLLLGWADIILLGLMKTSMDVGIYDAALPTASMIRVVLLAFAFLFMPVMTELFSRGKVKDMRIVFKASTRWIFVITFPAFLLMMLFPGTLLNMFFGPEFLGPTQIGAAALSILAVGFFYAAISGPVTEVTISLGKTKAYLAITAFMSILNLTLNILLIPAYGIIGAAVAMSASLMIGALLFLFFVNRMLGFNPFSRNLAKPLVSGIIAGAMIYLASNFLFEAISIPVAVLLGLAFLAMYIIMLLLMRSFTPEDLEILKAVERKSGLNIKPLRRLIKRFI